MGTIGGPYGKFFKEIDPEKTRLVGYLVAGRLGGREISHLGEILMQNMDKGLITSALNFLSKLTPTLRENFLKREIVKLGQFLSSDTKAAQAFRQQFQKANVGLLLQIHERFQLPDAAKVPLGKKELTELQTLLSGFIHNAVQSTYTSELLSPQEKEQMQKNLNELRVFLGYHPIKKNTSQKEQAEIMKNTMKEAIHKIYGLSEPPLSEEQIATIRTKLTPLLNLPEQAIQKQKEQFLYGQLGDRGSEIIKQTDQYPLLKAAVDKLSESYHEWSPFSPKQGELQARIGRQHRNIEALYDLLKDNPEIAQLRFETPLVQTLLTPYVQGSEDLASKREEVIAKMKFLAKEEAAEKPLDGVKPSISKTAIEKEAKLFDARRDAVIQAQGVYGLQRQGGSANIVVPFKDAEGAYKGFFKQGAGGEKAAGTFEKFMWDMAVIFGLADRFASTGTARMRTSDVIGESAKVLTKSGDYVEREKVSEEIAGGFQAAHKGITLEQHLHQGKELTKEAVIEATTTILAFGMFDAHGNNMIVDPDTGKLLFFDNTRSLPHGDLIYFVGDVSVGLRAGTLSSKHSYENLTNEEREKIRSEIARLESQIEVAKKFSTDKVTGSGKALESLPIGWWDSQDALAGMKQRLDRMKEALDPSKNGEPLNLRDLAFAANPQFKFFAALQLLGPGFDSQGIKGRVKGKSGAEKANIIKGGLLDRWKGKNAETIQRERSTNFSFLSTLLERAVELGINPAEIEEWCQKLKFDEVVEKMRDKLQDTSFIDYTPQARLVLKEKFAAAKVDLKDAARKDIAYHGFIIAQKFFALNEVAVMLDYRKIKVQDLNVMLRNGAGDYMIGIDEKPSDPFKPRFFLHYKGLDGRLRRAISLDYSKPGWVKGDEPIPFEMTMQDFLKEMEQFKSGEGSPDNPSAFQQALNLA